MPEIIELPSSPPVSLPIDRWIPAIQQAFGQSANVIIEATPGSGKTTRVPPALLHEVSGEVLVLEPRRLATRLSAERVALELGESVGESVGYQVRFERVVGPKTRLRFLTEGLLLRYLISNPTLKGVSAVVLDEFHERHLHTDVALALLIQLQRGVRPDLKLVVMSATLDVTTLAEHLRTKAIFRIEAPRFPVTVHWLGGRAEDNPAVAVARGVEQALTTTEDGHILVFLPGAAEIRRAGEAIAGLAARANTAVLELRSETARKDQEQVFANLGRRKIILATNIAETSLTIEGVVAVVDTGLAKIPSFAPWSGLPTLTVRPVSQASTIQRAGRAGRTGPGHVFRLYSEADWLRRPEWEKPEIERLDLTQMLLDVVVILDELTVEFANLAWLATPPEDRLVAARLALRLLGAIDERDKVTKLGVRLAKIPLHPRLARLVVAGVEADVAQAAVRAAAALSEGLPIAAAIQGAEDARRIRPVAEQIARSAGVDLSRRDSHSDDSELAACLLAAFPDRIARLRPSSDARGRREFNLCMGGGAVAGNVGLPENSEWCIVLDAEERLGASAADAVFIRSAVPIDPDLLALGPAALIRDEDRCEWDDAEKRVRSSRRSMYGALTIDSTQTRGETAAVAEVLTGAVLRSWPKPFEDASAVDDLRERVQLLIASGVRKADDVSASISAQSGEWLENFVRFICARKSSFRELAQGSLGDYLSQYLDPGLAKSLREYAPDFVTIGHGRRVRVHYDAGKPPWIASRLQDFFGTASTPTIAGGRVSLVVHLLAPNQRAVQITQDLSSFWKNSYQTLRRELSRNYPRHFWPENPMEAEPPPPRRPRGGG